MTRRYITTWPWSIAASGAQPIRAASSKQFLFRLFDILKPFPAGLIDRRMTGGLGVVGDDLVAGVYAGLLARLVLHLVR